MSAPQPTEVVRRMTLSRGRRVPHPIIAAAFVVLVAGACSSSGSDPANRSPAPTSTPTTLFKLTVPPNGANAP